MKPATSASQGAPGAEWQLVRTAADQLQIHGFASPDTDRTAVRLAVECLHDPQRLCCALALPAAAPTPDVVPDIAAESAAAAWRERAVIVTLLVQQLMQLLLRDSQDAAGVLGLSDGGITPSWHIKDAAIAARVVELLATHAELTAAVAALAGKMTSVLSPMQGSEAITAPQPLAASAAVRLLAFAAAQLQQQPLMSAESRNRGRISRHGGTQPEQQPDGYTIPLELAAYAVTLAQAAAAAPNDGNEYSCAMPQLAEAAWHVYVAADKATGIAAAGASSAVVALHDALQQVMDDLSQAQDTATAAGTAESAGASEVAQSPPTPSLTPSRPARASSGSSGPSLPAQRPPRGLPTETPLQTAVMRPLKPLSVPPSRRIRPQQVAKAKPVEAWADLQAAEQHAREQWNDFLACKEELISNILQEGKPEEYSEGSSGGADDGGSDDEAQAGEVSSPPSGGPQAKNGSASAPQPAAAPQDAQSQTQRPAHDPDAAVRSQLLCMSLWLFTTCLKAPQVDTAAVLGNLSNDIERCAAADKALLAIDPARGADRSRRVKQGAKLSPCGMGAVVLAHHLLDSMEKAAPMAAAPEAAALTALLLASRVELAQVLLKAAQPEDALMPSAKARPPRLLAAQLLQTALAIAPPAIVSKVCSSALRTWLHTALHPQLQSGLLSRDERSTALRTVTALLHTMAHDLGSDAKLPGWADRLMPAPPVGFVTEAPLPTRRTALRQLLELALEAAASLAPQDQSQQAALRSSTAGSHAASGQLGAASISPAAVEALVQRSGGIVWLSLTDVAAALLHRLCADVQAEAGPEAVLTGSARQQASIVQLAYETLTQSTAAVQQLAAQLSGGGTVDWHLAAPCVIGHQVWALLDCAPLKSVLDAANVRQAAQRQRPSSDDIQARRAAFATAQSALEAALEACVASGQAPPKSQHCKQQDPAEVLRALRLPAVLLPAQLQVNKTSEPETEAEASDRESLGSDSAPLRMPRHSSGGSTGKRKRRRPIANTFIASIAETEGGTRVDYDSEAATDVEQDETGRYLAPHETAWLLPMKEFIVCKKGRTKDDYKGIVQAINERATVKPRLMTGSTWQPAFATGEAECSDDDSLYSEAEDEDR